MSPPKSERGAALLSVLLLVAVMAAIAATALDRLTLATHLATNAALAGQGRAWVDAADKLATVRIEDLRAADKQKTLPAGWQGVTQRLPLPGGMIVSGTLSDGGNCFNLNSLVQPLPDGRLVSRPAGVRQFTGLMLSLGIDEGKAQRIAAAASDYIDADQFPVNGGMEDGGASLPSNQLMADPSELAAVAGVGRAEYDLLRGWVCALPTTDLSPLNINTLRPEQAPLIAMLAPDRLSVERVRQALAMRPASGLSSGSAFWQLPPLAGSAPPLDAMDQLRTVTDFFLLRTEASGLQMAINEMALIDARQKPARVVWRRRTDGA